MDSTWFKEDRALPKAEQAKAMEETELAVRNSSILLERLKRILNEGIQGTYSKEENIDSPNWERVALGAAVERKTLRKILNLLP